MISPLANWPQLYWRALVNHSTVNSGEVRTNGSEVAHCFESMLGEFAWELMSTKFKGIQNLKKLKSLKDWHHSRDRAKLKSMVVMRGINIYELEGSQTIPIDHHQTVSNRLGTNSRRRSKTVWHAIWCVRCFSANRVECDRVARLSWCWRVSPNSSAYRPFLLPIITEFTAEQGAAAMFQSRTTKPQAWTWLEELA